jgi:hypothetical protein
MMTSMATSLLRLYGRSGLKKFEQAFFSPAVQTALMPQCKTARLGPVSPLSAVDGDKDKDCSLGVNFDAACPATLALL